MMKLEMMPRDAARSAIHTEPTIPPPATAVVQQYSSSSDGRKNRNDRGRSIIDPGLCCCDVPFGGLWLLVERTWGGGGHIAAADIVVGPKHEACTANVQK